MPRLKIEIPAAFSFSTEIPLYIRHINYGHHPDNAQLMSLVSEARVRFFKFLGYTELDVEGVGIIVADVAAQYRSEAFHGETLLVRMAANDFNKYGCDLVWQLADKDSGREIARGKHGIMFFDYTERKPTTVPPAFIAKAGAA